jgi:hypothetical protein
MTISEAQGLKVGQRVRWHPIEPGDKTETGIVTTNTSKAIRIAWDDEDFERTYAINEANYHGLLHVEKIAD